MWSETPITRRMLLLYQHDRHAGRRKPHDQRVDRLRFGLVEPRRGLVEQQQLGPSASARAISRRLSAP